MRGEVPIKYVLKGDREAGKRFMRRGAVMMGMLEHGMTYQGLKQSVMRRWVTPDVLIECDCRFGLRTVTITVPVITPEQTSERQERKVMRIMVIVSDSTGFKLYHAENLKADFSAGRPLYGHYETLAEGYYFQQHSMDAYTEISVPRTLIDDETAEVRRTDAKLFPNNSLSMMLIREEEGHFWNAPALMPGTGQDEFFIIFNTGYEKDLPQIVMSRDCLSLAEVSICRYDQDGRQARKSKFANIGRGADYPNIATMPERNGTRRWITMPLWGGLYNPGLFALFYHVSARQQHEIRAFPFRPERLFNLYPEALHGLMTQKFTYAGNAYAFMSDDGRTHVCHPIIFHNQLDDDATYPTGFYDEDDPLHTVSKRWGLSYYFVHFPALTSGMTRAEEEAAILAETQISVVTCEQFLPLLDQISEADTILSTDHGPGMRPMLQARHWEDPYQTSWSEWAPARYEIDGVVHHPGGDPFDIDGDPFLQSVNWDRAWWTMALLFGMPVPNDNVVFHSGVGYAFYTWTRDWGGFAITDAGMFRLDMTMPDAVANEPGVKPNITYAGGGLYCCVCDRLGDVRDVCIGAPFDTNERDAGWMSVTLTTPEWRAAGNRIVHVRPLHVTEARVALLAIVREAEGPRYRLAVCDGNPAAPGTTMLKFYGVIPLEEADGMAMDVGLCGEHEYVEMLKRYPSPPHAREDFYYSGNYQYYYMRVRPQP